MELFAKILNSEKFSSSQVIMETEIHIHLLTTIFSYVFNVIKQGNIKNSSASLFSIHISRIFRSSHRRCSVKKVLLEISQENTCARASLFNKVAGLRSASNIIKKETLAHVFSYEFCLTPATSLRKRPWHRYFHVTFVKFLRAAFLQNTSGRLLLYMLLWKIFRTQCYRQSLFLSLSLILSLLLLSLKSLSISINYQHHFIININMSLSGFS